MTDNWRPIAGYEDLYSVSDHGEVKSLRSGRLVSLCNVTDGYKGVKLHRAGRAHNALVHRLVCAAFNGPPQAGQQVAHLNGNPQDNTAANLAWVSPKENTAHKIAHGTLLAGERHPRARLTLAQVAEIRASTEKRKEIAARFGISQWTVKEIRGGKRWKEACQSGGETASPIPCSPSTGGGS